MRVPTIVVAALAGAGATVPMTAWMASGDRARRIGTPPPLRIVRHVRPTGSRHADRRRAAILHLLIGAVGGVAAEALGAGRGDAAVATVPIGTAVGLWATGYELVVPSLGVLPPAHRDRARAGALLEAHIVYGAALALLRAVLGRGLARRS